MTQAPNHSVLIIVVPSPLTLACLDLLYSLSLGSDGLVSCGFDEDDDDDGDDAMMFLLVHRTRLADISKKRPDGGWIAKVPAKPHLCYASTWPDDGFS